MLKIAKYKNFLIVFFTVFYTTSTLFWAFTATSPWIQTDWSGGSGQTNWSDETMFDSSSNVVTSAASQVTLSVSEKLSNTGFESNLTGWSSSTQTLTSQPSAASGVDTSIQQAVAARNFGITTTMAAGSQIGANTNRRSLVSFDITSIPASAAISSATLTLVCSAETNTTDRNVGAHRALTQWFEGNQDNGNPAGGENASTWNLRNTNGSVAWAGGAGGASGSDFSASATATTAITSTGTFNWNVTSDVSAWLAGTATNYGWWIINADEATSASQKTFDTSDNVTAGNRPKLVVNYTFGTRSTATTYNSSSGSAFLAPGSNGTGTFTQSVNVGDTNSYNISAYAYTDGSAVSSSDLSLYYNGSTVSTTYTSIGSGWYRLTGTVTGVASSVGAGVQVASGKSVYIDDVSLNSYVFSGTLTSSIFDTEQSSNWGTLTYNATTPTNTTVTVKARTSNSSSMSGATDFSSCDAITSGADITSNNCITDSQRYIQYQVALATTDTLATPTFQDITIAFASGGGGDVTPPSISLTALSPDPTTDNTPSFTGTVTDSAGTVTAVEFQVDSTSGAWSSCTADDGGFDEASEAFTCTTSTLANGEHTMYVRAIDNVNNTTATIDLSSDTFTVAVSDDEEDTSPPNISLVPLSPDPTTDKTPTLTGTATDSAGTINNVQFQMDSTSGSWSSCTADDGAFDEASEDFSCTATTLSNGTHTMYVRATDSNGNTTSDVASDTFTVNASSSSSGDTTAPTTITLDSPSGYFYTKDDRPTFKWKKTTDDVALSKYQFQVDNGDSGDFTIDNIPTSQSSVYENLQYKIKYSDTTISLNTKSSLGWGLSSNNGALKEGKRTWTVTAVDTSNNQASTSRVILMDKTKPTVEFTKVNTTAYNSALSKMQTTDTTPTISGKIVDKLAGDSSNNKVASGPSQIKLTIEKNNGLTYTLASSYIFNITSPLYTCNNLKVSDRKENKCDKYATFSITPKSQLPFGEYRVSVVGIDSVGNTSAKVSFKLEINSYKQMANLQQQTATKNTVKKPEITIQNKPIISTSIKNTPNIAKIFASGIKAFGNDYKNITNLIKSKLLKIK